MQLAYQTGLTLGLCSPALKNSCSGTVAESSNTTLSIARKRPIWELGRVVATGGRQHALRTRRCTDLKKMAEHAGRAKVVIIVILQTIGQRGGKGKLLF